MKPKIIISLICISFILGCSSWLIKKDKYFPFVYSDDFSIITRQNWGWQPLDQSISEQTIKRITLHHGGVEFAADEDPIKYLVNLQKWSRTEKGWIDIPYHFMVDLDGQIYEARPLQFPGDTNTDYDVKGHALICVMGNYEIQKINKNQLDNISKLTAFLAKKYNVPIDLIKGHKDYTETACPGKDLYRYLEDSTIQKRVKLLISQ